MSKSFANRVGGYLNKPFLRGGKGPNGYDCIGFVAGFFTDWGKPFPEEYNGITLDTYPDLYDKDLAAAEKLMMEAFRTIGNEVKLPDKVAGDLIIVKHQNGHLFPAVYVGNCQAVAAFLRTGVRVFSLDTDNQPVLARRFD